MAKVLIGCETSGIVRDAFLALGHDAWSCDILPPDTPTNRHIQDDVRTVMRADWDLMAVMHPPCTRLCNSGVRWLSQAPPGRTLEDMWAELDEGAKLFSAVWNVQHIPCVAVENPVMHKHAKARIENYQPPAQTVQPWQFGDDANGPDNERKRTCFWLRNLPPLCPTGSLDGTTARDTVAKASPGANRWKVRSKFFPGMAKAMAEQWSVHAFQHLAEAA
ncbi:hypothetical protein [Tateyamaria sp. syn59]|uniref:hypothetical protein n=1 Tax=Tateyamaria sp. syn59 TaxID=2576942 RepID=UPI0011BDCE44|nr:hypothetical protein [Tateyamaria sp. syn59]